MTDARLFDPEAGVTVVRPPGHGEGWWAGAPSRATWRGTELLTYRLRAPRPRRGYEVRIARLDGDRAVDLSAIHAADLASASLERACLVATDDELLLFLSFVDPSDGRWRIDLVTAPEPSRFAAASRTSVFSADSTASEGVKDPVVVAEEGGFTMYASVAVSTATPDHATGDVFGTGTVRSATGLARSTDGHSWSWEGVVLRPPDQGWDAYETRISCLLAPDLALYDGIPRPEDNYAERTGIARRGMDGAWQRVTTDGPVLPVRYVAFDGERFFWEHALPDGSHELRAAMPSGEPDTAALSD